MAPCCRMSLLPHTTARAGRPCRAPSSWRSSVSRLSRNCGSSGGSKPANMQSCQTRMPNSSQASQKSGPSYDVSPVIRTMFMPASTTRRRDARTAPTPAPSVTMSGGTQQAPRQKSGTPFNDRVNAPPSRSTSTVRNPTAPRSCSVPPATSTTGYRG